MSRAPVHSAEHLFDRAGVAKQIAILRAEHAAMPEFRKAVVECFFHTLTEARAQVRSWFEADGGGLACTRNLSRIEDDLIRAIHDYVVTYVYPLENPSTSERLAIVAVGGYGRGTLASQSDIDLLFLLPYKQTPWGESVVEAILYVLWDMRQKVGHATRSLDECMRQAKADMTIRTAMLEARLIDGDAALFAQLRARFRTEIVDMGARDFVAAKLAERETRVHRAGQSRYLVEPNVKEGKGGLRDLNTLFWISKYVYKVSEVKELVTAGLFTTAELRLFERCEEFLWRVRCHIHFVTGRAEERLTFDLQRVIAGRLGYKSHSGLNEVERFMKHYFLIAKDVGDLTNIVCAALEEKQAKPRAMLNRLVGKLRRRATLADSKDFAIETDRITVASADVFEKDPVNLIRLYWLADRNSLAIHPDATRLVTLSLKRIDANIRANAEANRLFLDIVTSKRQPETVLRRMNEAGVLGRFIPEFGRIVAMMQFNMYHHYTVDEHLLRAIGVLSELDRKILAQELPLSTEIFASISNRTALYVAVFLHDIAKGREEDHSIAGARLARSLCPRFGLSDAETETVVWLIDAHLIMSNTAQGRDLSDPKTIETFAATVQTLERLKMLLILTVCDIRAVGPGVWNAWKAQLLRNLYWETEVVLSGGYSAMDRKHRVYSAQEQLRAVLPGWSDPEFDEYAARHYPAYWLKVDLAHKVQHAKLFRLSGVELRSLITEVQTNPEKGVTEVTIIAPDHPRLLSIIAGGCAAAGGNIVDAQIFTTSDGFALDTIVMTRAFEREEDELRRANRVAQTIEKALRGEIRLAPLMAEKSDDRKGHAQTFKVAPEVILDNNLSHRYSVLEVSGLDRPGLLHELTAVLSKLNLNIGSAHIVTFGEKAVDAFYVTDLTGAKITNPARQISVKRNLLEVFDKKSETSDAKALQQSVS